MADSINTDDALLDRAARRYARLLRLYPPAFRRACADDMLDTFESLAADALRDAGPAGLRDVWRRVLAELFPTLLREHWDRIATTPARTLRLLIALATPILPYAFLLTFARQWPEVLLVTVWFLGTS